MAKNETKAKTKQASKGVATTTKAGSKRSSAKKSPAKKSPAKKAAKKTKPVSAVDTLIKGIQSKYTGAIVGKASDLTMSWLGHRRPTGLLNLDIALRGGLQPGGLIQFFGGDSSYKSGLANAVLAENQRIYKNRSAVFIAMTEHRYDKELGAIDGFEVRYSDEEIRRMAKAVGQPLTKEQIAYLRFQPGVVTETAASTADIVLSIVYELAQSNLYQIGIIDSIASYISDRYADNEIGSAKVAGNSLVNQDFINKLATLHSMGTPTKEANLTTIIAINQYRSRVQTGFSRSFGPDYSQQGGYALKHGKFVDLFLTPGAMHVDKNTKKRLGRYVNWEILKGKCGLHEGGKGRFRYVHNRGIDLNEISFNVGVEKGIISRNTPTGHHYTLDLGGGALLKGNSADNMIRSFNQEIRDYIRDIAFDLENISVVFDEKELG